MVRYFPSSLVFPQICPFLLRIFNSGNDVGCKNTGSRASAIEGTQVGMAQKPKVGSIPKKARKVPQDYA
jgi:hypothetical protein